MTVAELVETLIKLTPDKECFIGDGFCLVDNAIEVDFEGRNYVLIYSQDLKP